MSATENWVVRLQLIFQPVLFLYIDWKAFSLLLKWTCLCFYHHLINISLNNSNQSVNSVNIGCWARRLCGYCAAADKHTPILLVMMLFQLCTFRSPPPCFIGWVDAIFVFISSSPATRAGKGTHAALVGGGTSVVQVLGRVLQSRLSCPQSLGAYAAWACTNRLRAAQAGLVWLKLAPTGFTPVEAVTYYRADWPICLLSCAVLDFFKAQCALPCSGVLLIILFELISFRKQNNPFKWNSLHC